MRPSRNRSQLDAATPAIPSPLGEKNRFRDYALLTVIQLQAAG